MQEYEPSSTYRKPDLRKFLTPISSKWYGVSILATLSLLAATYAGWQYLGTDGERDNANHLKQVVAQTDSRFKARLLAYDYALQGVSGYIGASEFVEPEEWREYIDALTLPDYLPGLLGLGYVGSQKVGPLPLYSNGLLKSDQDNWVEQTAPIKTLLSRGHLQQKTSIISLAKSLASNGSYTSLMMVYPHFEKPAGVDSDPVLRGIVFAPVQENNLFRGLLPETKPEAVFKVYALSPSGEPGKLLYDETLGRRLLNREKPYTQIVTFNGHSWLFNWYPTQYFKNSASFFEARLLLALGLLLTALMAALLFSLNRTRDQAVSIATQTSGELKDTTQKLKGELEARERLEETLQLALNATDDGLWDWNIATGEVYFSPKWCEIIGYDPKDIKGHYSSWEVLLHPDDKASVTAILSDHLSGKRPDYNAEFRMKTKTGDWRWILTRGKVISRDKEGQPLRAIGTHTDITDRKKITEDLKKASQRLQMAIDCSSQGLWDWNVKTGRIYIDQSWFNMLNFDGKKASDRVRTWMHTVHHQDIKQVVREVARHFRGLTPICDVEYRQLDGQGNWVWVCSKGRVVERNASGKPLRMIGTTQDISKRKEMDKHLLEAMLQAEQASRHKSEFLANMSHEIRTPMNGILGMTEIALGTELSEKQRHYLQMVYTSAQALLNVINDILDFSKIEAGKFTLNPVGFKFMPLLEETLYPMQHLAEEKGLHLQYQVDSDIPANLFGDPVRLRQILNNLVGNAIKFTAAGSVNVDLSLREDDEKSVELLLVVSDSGIGLTDEQQARIFDPFVQADNSSSRKFGGTGLGLSITNQLVKMMDGKLWVESELGTGSTFSCTMTLQKSSAAAIAETVATPLPQDEKKETQIFSILLVEDNAINQAVAVNILEKAGHEVQVAQNGREAVDYWENARQGKGYDLILMDMHMPEMDGFEATRAIRNLEEPTNEASNGSEHIPIIALTASAMLGDAEKCLAAGMDAYVSKPFKREELLNAIQSACATYTKD